MIKILLCPVLLFSLFCSAQIGLEHDFYDGVASRIVLENSGEKYYLFDKQSSAIKFYNSDYTFWKTVPLAVPLNTYSLVIHHVSETKINSDDHVEISYTFGAPSKSRIVNDEGTVLLSVDNCLGLMVDEKESLPIKIISATTGNHVVYSVPGLLPEHTFTEEVTRVNLENSGEKYYALDPDNSIVNLYNADFSFWKSIALFKPDGYTVSNISLLSENQVNSDNLVEVGYRYHNPAAIPNSESKIINENGLTLLTLPNINSMWINSVEGLSNKLFTDTSAWGEWTINYATNIYSIPDFNFEHAYSGIAARTNLENSGEKYYIESYNPDTWEIIIYNSDHSPWKTVAVPILNPAETIHGVNISETQIDADDQVELIYTVSSNTLDGGHYVTRVVKEDGSVLLTLGEAFGVQLSIFPNLPYKLIARVQSGPFDNTVYFSSVYGVDGVFAVEGFSTTSVSVSPNPAANNINLQSEIPIIKADIFDMRGILIATSYGNDIKNLNVESYATGIYLMHLTDNNGAKTAAKIVVAH